LDHTGHVHVQEGAAATSFRDIQEADQKTAVSLVAVLERARDRRELVQVGPLETM
jgi:hypothetical protein